MTALDSTTSITLAGVMCWDEGVREEFGRSSPRAVRKLVCRWTDRLDLVNRLLGYATSTGGTTTVAQPLTYKGAPFLVCTHVEIEGTGMLGADSDGDAAYPYARLRVIYDPSEFNNDGHETGNENLDFSSEVVALPMNGPSLYWSNGDAVDPRAAPAIHFTTATFSRTLYSQPTLPVNLIFTLLDTVNQGPFLGAAAGKVRFLGARTHRRFTATGAKNWDITLAFLYRSIEHNKSFRANLSGDAGGWQDIYLDESLTQQPYPPADYSAFNLA